MNKVISINHGSGGLLTRNLINDLFIKNFNNEIIKELTDSAIIKGSGHLAFTTDGYVIDPIFFPGGNIGKLAVCGTVNDLSVSGAKPLYLSTSYIIEEGFPLEQLENIIESMAEEARNAGIKIVSGDTKVVQKGKCDKLFITTSGIGIIDKQHLHIGSGKKIKTGDQIIINGTIGDHSITITSARELLRFKTDVVSDCASLNNIIGKVLNECMGVAFMRDVTRGGLGAVLCELVSMIKYGIDIYENNIPIKEGVSSACEIFGFDPLFLANEGKFIMVIDPSETDKALEIMKSHPFGGDAAVIGEITNEHPGKVVMTTQIGGKRLIAMPMGGQLPRIC
jgi:hydrogenase expression/formation protein HypE